MNEGLQPTPTPAHPPGGIGAFAPLGNGVFRTLWLVWLISNVCMWMNDVAAAWLMTSLSGSPVMVALVQTASTLPVFLLGLPSGAIADIVDRRRLLLTTQFWIAATGTLLSLTVSMGWIDAPLLLGLTLLNGVALALRWPVHSALIAEIVPRPQLPSALALSGVAMNASRIIGPTIAGALIASLGTGWVFGTNAALAVVSGTLLVLWRRPTRPLSLPGERFLGAMRVGIQHVRQSDRMRAALLRVSLFFMHSSALMAMMPLIAKSLPGGSAGTYTMMMSATGLGAVLSVFMIPRWRRTLPHDAIIRRGIVVQAAMMVAVVFAPNVWLALPALFVNGVAWLTVANTISVTAQLSLPNWVRARGMSMYQMALMGSTAAGAAFWGQIATFTSVRTGVLAAAISGCVALWLTRRHEIASTPPDDLTPSARRAPPDAGQPVDGGAGPVVVTIEYRVDPARAAGFDAVMQETRRRRLSQGALSWTLLRDTADPAVWVEHIVDETWHDHLRRFDRLTAVDDELRARRYAFHIGEAPPRVTRCVAWSAPRG